MASVKLSVSVGDELWQLAQFVSPESSPSAIVQAALDQYVRKHVTPDVVEELAYQFRTKMLNEYIITREGS